MAQKPSGMGATAATVALRPLPPAGCASTPPRLFPTIPSSRHPSMRSRSVTLVSKRWRRCFFESSDLWRSLTLQPRPPGFPQAAASTAAKRVVLCRVGGFLQHLCLLFNDDAGPDAYLGRGGDQTAAISLLDSTAPSYAARLQLAALLDSLAPRVLPQLRSLTIFCDMVPLGTASALRRLSTLHELGLVVNSHAPMPTEVVQAVAQSLSMLSFLELSSFAAPMPDLQQLTQLSGLVKLSLAEGPPDEEEEEEAQAGPELEVRTVQPMQPPYPAVFPALKVCLFSSRPHGLQVGCTREYAGRRQALPPCCACMPTQQQHTSCQEPRLARVSTGGR